MFEIEYREHIAIVRMAHGRANAMDTDFLGALIDEFEGLAARDPAAVVLTGRDGVFSAGADLFKVRDGSAAEIEEGLHTMSKAFLAVFAFPRPVVAAINGHAIAGGAVLAGACDWRTMSAGTIGLGELRVGVPFPAAALEIVRFAIGAKHLQEILYLADAYAPEDALRRHLVDEVVEPDRLEARALEMAARLAAIPAASFTHTKRALRRDALASIARHAPEADAEAIAIWSSDELHARIDEFLIGMFGDRARKR